MNLKLSENDIEFADQAEEELKRVALANALGLNDSQQLKEDENGNLSNALPNTDMESAFARLVNSGENVAQEIRLQAYRTYYIASTIIFILIFYLLGSGIRQERSFWRTACEVQGIVSESVETNGYQNSGRLGSREPYVYYKNYVTYSVAGIEYEKVPYCKSEKELLNSVVTIYYEPEHPEKIAFERKSHKSVRVLRTILLILSVVSGIVMILFFVKPEWALVYVKLVKPYMIRNHRRRSKG